MNLEDYIESNSELKSADEIVFFGGSFNPWHAGHKSCVELLPKEKMLIILPDHNPYKELVDSKLSSVEEIQQDIKDLNGNMFIYDGFLKANKKNPTHSWLDPLKKTMPNKSFSLLMGFDTFTGIDSWIDASKLLSLLKKLYVVSRLDVPEAKKFQVARLSQIAPELEVEFLGHHNHEELSSTKIRQNKS